MIVSDEKRFVFVHIPKCGGTSVRKLLMPHKTPHEGLGGASGDHRPLCQLERDHPILWKKLTRYNSFTIVRRPESRFFSCVMQRIIDFSDIGNPTATEYSRACAADIAFLSSHPNSREWPDEYIHFVPQTEYIFRDETQIIERLFPLERPADLLAYLSTELNVETPGSLTHSRKSASTRYGVLRGPTRIAKNLLRPVSSGSMGDGLKAMLRRIMTPDFSVERVLGPAKHKSYEAFVRSFYAADVQLWSSVLNGASCSSASA